MEEDTRLHCIVPGTTVNIQRTDGRIHNALIATVNIENDSVTVEWFEKGDTKGKEIEIDHLLRLNPGLIKKYPEISKPSFNRLTRNYSHSGLPVPVRNNKSKQKEDGSPPVTSTRLVDSSEEQENSFNSKDLSYQMKGLQMFSNGKNMLNEERNDNYESMTSKLLNDSSNRTPKNEVFGQTEYAFSIPNVADVLMLPNSISPRKTESNYQEQSYKQQKYESNKSNKERSSFIFDKAKNSQKPNITKLVSLPNKIPQSARLTRKSDRFTAKSSGPFTVPKKSLSKEDRLEEVEENTPISARSKQSIDNNSLKIKIRRSCVVREVEKLKKKREERRQRQAEEKAEKEAFMSKTPGNPHWELLKMVNEFQASLEFHPLTMNDSVEEHQISVCVRKRPMNKKELTRKEIDVITVPTKNTLIVHEPKNKVDLTKYLENQTFRFDYVFDDSCSNDLVYKYTAQPLVLTVFEGNMATCFAYGQTGSGKTHTMGGDFHGKTQECHKGIYALVAKDIFDISSNQYESMNFVVAASFFEIYSGKVFDLLNKKTRLRILEDGKQQVQVVGLTEKLVTTVGEVLKLIQLGNTCRTSGQTSANTNSSRSHAVFQIALRLPGYSKIYGKFSLIDLAGNERGSDTSSSDRLTRMEGAEINKSLLALKECIRALGKKDHHLPFRASKLTQILRDSFIGDNSKTCMIAMISPGISSCEHTLNTLRYADRVKELEISDEIESKNDIQEDTEPDLLNSINENEMNDELKQFHKVMNALMATEEALVENHKNINDYLDQMLQKSNHLYRKANTVDYDQEYYSEEFEELLEDGIGSLQSSLKLVKEFRNKLSMEEQLSRTMKSTNNTNGN